MESDAIAPFLSFYEAMIYTGLNRRALIDVLDRLEQPYKHISRARLDYWLKRYAQGRRWDSKHFGRRFELIGSAHANHG